MKRFHKKQGNFNTYPACKIWPLFFLIFSGLLSSCISISKIYRFDPNTQLQATLSDSVAFINLVKKRDSLHVVSTSLIKKMEKERFNGRVKSFDLNQTYQIFGQQLAIDQQLASTFLSKNYKNDSLTFIKQNTVFQLLISASNYEKTYYNSYFRKSLNRGDIGNHIPYNILSQKLKLLYSPHFRRSVNNTYTTSVYCLNNFTCQLPKPSYFKTLYFTFVPIGGFTKFIAYQSYQFFGSLIFRHHEYEPKNRKASKILAKELIAFLKPFDIIITKSNEYLTNQIIPGCFTHAAIWLGPGKLNRFMDTFRFERNLTDKHITYRDKYLAESITSGVHIGNLHEIVTNHLSVIIRPVNLSYLQQDRVISNLAKQKSKKYDFYFDFKSQDRVNCTELVFLAYDFIPWEMQFFMNDLILSPDDIVKTALTSPYLKIVAIIQNNKLLLSPNETSVKELVYQ
jgi:hypothetical protein